MGFIDLKLMHLYEHNIKCLQNKVNNGPNEYAQKSSLIYAVHNAGRKREHAAFIRGTLNPEGRTFLEVFCRQQQLCHLCLAVVMQLTKFRDNLRTKNSSN
jgi:hypothetical protein